MLRIAFWLFIVPGSLVATLIDKMRRIVNGTDNNSGMIGFVMYSAFFGTILWLVMISGGI